jgi:hypothetical protein
MVGNIISESVGGIIPERWAASPGIGSPSTRTKVANNSAAPHRRDAKPLGKRDDQRLVIRNGRARQHQHAGICDLRDAIERGLDFCGIAQT